jgi:hypothetical protein
LEGVGRRSVFKYGPFVCEEIMVHRHDIERCQDGMWDRDDKRGIIETVPVWEAAGVDEDEDEDELTCCPTPVKRLRCFTTMAACVDRFFSFIPPSFYTYVPYGHVFIAVVAHVVLYSTFTLYIGAGLPEYLRGSILAAALRGDPTVKNIKVASVAIGVPLVLDLMFDVATSLVSYRAGKENGAQIVYRAKEWTVRLMFVLCLTEPAFVILAAPPTDDIAVFAYISAFAKNITFVCMGCFSLTNTFDRMPRQFFRSFLISALFTAGQLMMHFAAMSANQTPQVQLLAALGVYISVLPLAMYMYYCYYFTRIIFLKTRREGGFSNVTLREYLFLAYSVATGVGIIVTCIVVFGFNGLYYYNSSLMDLEVQCSPRAYPSLLMDTDVNC